MLSNSLLDRIGYYTVGDQAFVSKIEALEYATKTNVHPNWHFNEQSFDHYDWTKEPEQSVDELYRRRAQQLREQYDNLILYYSGGIDSHNVLTTFIKNNIKLDSVIIYGTFGFDRDRCSRFNLELYNVAIPFAQQHQDLYDLQLLDISPYYEKYYHSDWLYESGVQLSPHEFLMAHLPKDPAIQKYLEKGNTAVIRGLDKPRVIFNDNRYQLGFLDSAIMQLTSADDRSNIELFYWSPDCPWLVCKQAHIIKNYCKNINPSVKPLFTHTEHFVYSTMEQYVSPLIYDVGYLPGQAPTYYSLGKGGGIGPVLHHKDNWFHSTDIELNSQKFWHQGIAHADTVIDPKYKKNGNIKNGLVGLWSKWYDLGV